MRNFTGRDGLLFSVARIGGAYVLRIARGDAQREERWDSRDQVWERIVALRGQVML